MGGDQRRTLERGAAAGVAGLSVELGLLLGLRAEGWCVVLW